MPKKSYQSAVIDIGAHSVRMDIFQVNSHDECRIIESLNQPLNLGTDVFRYGVVTPRTASELCECLKKFKVKLDEYGITQYRAFATSAIREASNKELLIKLLAVKASIVIEILEVQEEARLVFLEVKRTLIAKLGRQAFEDMNALIFIAGTGSLLLSYFHNGRMQFFEATTYGTVRLYDEFGREEIASIRLAELFNSLKTKRLLRPDGKLRINKPLTLIGVGASVRLLFAEDSEKQKNIYRVSKKEFDRIAEKFNADSLEALVGKLDLFDYQAIGLKPCAAIIDELFKGLSASELIVLKVNTRNAVMAELSHTGTPDDFVPDLLSIVKNIGLENDCDAVNGLDVAQKALQIFDKIRFIHKIDKHCRILLQVASFLHDIGERIDVRQHHKHSYYILKNTPICGLLESEALVVATVSRYHRRGTPKDSHPEYAILNGDQRVLVLQLTAILRLADALNSSLLTGGGEMRLELHRNELKIYIEDRYNALEWKRAYIEKKGELFKNIFALNFKVEKDIIKL